MISYQINNISKNEWYDLLRQFDDASIYQTWAFAENHWKGQQVDHFILKNDEVILSIAQIALIKFPLVNKRIAYVLYGPLFSNIDNLELALKYLKYEYVEKRKLFLRIVPGKYDDGSDEVYKKYQMHGYRKNTILGQKRTMVTNLSDPLDDLFNRFEKSARYLIRKCQKDKSLTIQKGTDADYFDIFGLLYDEMKSIKNIGLQDCNEYKKIQADLPEDMKMTFVISVKDAIPISASIETAIGNRSITLFSASNATGRKNNASYLVRWIMLTEMQKRGITKFDQGGINPVKNPGGYHFKKQFAGRDIYLMPVFDISSGIFISFVMFVFDTYRENYQQFFKNLLKFRNKRT